MAKVFLSYPFTGEDLEKLAEILQGIMTSLISDGHEVFCALLQKQQIDDLGIVGYEARLHYCLQQQEKAQLVLALILSEIPSNGMRQELIQAQKNNQPYLLFIKKSLHFPEFREYAQKVVEFTTAQDLQNITKLQIDETPDSDYSVVA